METTNPYYTPASGALTDKVRLVIVTDLEAFYESCRFDTHREWDARKIMGVMDWAVLDPDQNKACDSVMFIPDEPITGHEMLTPDAFFAQEWQRYLELVEFRGEDCVNLDVVFYRDCNNRQDINREGFDTSSSFTVRVNVFGAEFDYCSNGLGRLKKALEFYGFNTDQFISRDGVPQWDLLRSELYEEIVIIDEKGHDNPKACSVAYQVPLIQPTDPELEALLDEEERIARGEAS